MREIASEEHLQALFSLSAAMQYVAATIFLSGTAGIYFVNTTNQEKGVKCYTNVVTVVANKI